MHEIPLAGCGPTPLASYLKALGVFRVVSEQADGEARAWWHNRIFWLRARLDEKDLIDFFLHQYAPAPVVAPWNGGSGFYEKDSKDGIEAMERSRATRFERYREVIRTCREVLRAHRLTTSPKGESKWRLVATLRSRLPEEAVVVLDAATVLTGEGAVRYPPLLGTGWIDGHLEFSKNFMQQLAGLFDTESGDPLADARTRLESALFERPSPSLIPKAIGQFDPGAVGGPNGTVGFEAASLVNPWDFVLMVEGALVFAGAATRRHSPFGRTRASYPFTVEATGAGGGGTAFADEAVARAELWLPLWPRPASLREIRAIFSEGRLTLGRRLARDGLEAAQAIAALGVDRGVSSFQRYGLFMRSGRSYLAVPIAEVAAHRNLTVDLIADLERRNWLERVRRAARTKNRSIRYAMLVRKLEEALFEMTQRPAPSVIETALIAVAALERHVGQSSSLREVIQPIPTLAEEWLRRADDGSVEFRLASAVASLGPTNLSLRPFVYPVAPAKTMGLFDWSPTSKICVWRRGDVLRSMSAVLSTRITEVGRAKDGNADATARPEPLESSRGAGLPAVADFLFGRVDLVRLGDLLAALSLVAVPKEQKGGRDDEPFLPLAYAMLKLLFVPRRLLASMRILPEGRAMSVPPTLLRELDRGGDGGRRALEAAARRLRGSGVRLAHEPNDLGGIDGRRMAAAMLIPLDGAAVGRVFNRIGIREERMEGVNI